MCAVCADVKPVARSSDEEALSQNLPQNRVVKTIDLYYAIEIEEMKLPNTNEN